SERFWESHPLLPISLSRRATLSREHGFIVNSYPWPIGLASQNPQRRVRNSVRIDNPTAPPPPKIMANNGIPPWPACHRGPAPPARGAAALARTPGRPPLPAAVPRVLPSVLSPPCRSAFAGGSRPGRRRGRRGGRNTCG